MPGEDGLRWLTDSVSVTLVRHWVISICLLTRFSTFDAESKESTWLIEATDAQQGGS